jgi:AraC-like DNA-binding protein
LLEYVNIVLRLLSISQVLLFILLLLCSDNPKRVRGIGILLMLGIVAYLGMSLIDDSTPYMDQISFLWYLSAITPSLMLLFVWFIFEENCHPPIWVIALVSVSVLASLYYQFTDIGLPGSPWWLQALKTGIAAVAIFVVWRGRDNDLVEMRAKIRNVFIFSLTLMAFIVVTVEVLTGFNPPIALDLLTSLAVFIFSITLNYFVIRLNPTLQLLTPPLPVQPATEDPMMQSLLDKMQRERLYADHDLRVGSLAKIMKLPEYKLRQKINQELGYRNFNQFVNRYRIEEAGVKLREDARVPVLSIALDVGFRSISSFNTAFQDHFGVSPTKYRAEFLSKN